VSDLPELPGPVWGLVGRPSWREARIRTEVAALEAHPIWHGEGVPEGHGRRVVLAPGFLAGPRSMSRLEPWLRRAGWDTRRAPVGRNNMPAQVVMALLEDWLAETAGLEGGPVPVIGHSRGGQQARVLAVRRPHDVSMLVTLGAPLRVLYPPHVLVRAPAVALRARAKVRRQPTDHEGNARYEADRTARFPEAVPFVSVYSRTDGFLDWRLCLDPAAEAVEIDCTHFGLTTSIPAFQAIADALRRLDG
jgi:pimeloyl-ACP methyl ester carboxylesterase